MRELQAVFISFTFYHWSKTFAQVGTCTSTVAEWFLPWHCLFAQQIFEVHVWKVIIALTSAWYFFCKWKCLGQCFRHFLLTRKQCRSFRFWHKNFVDYSPGLHLSQDFHFNSYPWHPFAKSLLAK